MKTKLQCFIKKSKDQKREQALKSKNTKVKYNRNSINVWSKLLTTKIEYLSYQQKIKDQILF